MTSREAKGPHLRWYSAAVGRLRRCRSPAPTGRDCTAESNKSPHNPRLLLALAGFCLSATACFDYRNPVYDDLGSIPSCASFAVWEGEWAARELDLVLALSSLRALETSCGELQFGGNAPRLELVPELRCAAREHAANMGHRRRLTHTSGDGRGPSERIYDAGYQGIPRGELIARGELDLEEVIASWLEDPEQCAAILDRELDEVGAGLWVRGKDDAYWVLTLGTRR